MEFRFSNLDFLSSDRGLPVIVLRICDRHATDSAVGKARQQDSEFRGSLPRTFYVGTVPTNVRSHAKDFTALSSGLSRSELSLVGPPPVRRDPMPTFMTGGFRVDCLATLP